MSRDAATIFDSVSLARRHEFFPATLLHLTRVDEYKKMSVLSLLRKLPPPAIAKLLYLRDLSRTITNSRGLRVRDCNICGYRGRFLGFGSPIRYDALCPRCGGAERHRLLYMFFREREDVVAEKNVLHFAPEASIKAFVLPRSASYTGADVQERPGCEILDIENLMLDDASFDTIICSHILEHVDDRKALSELFRVLRPGGIALLMSPVVEGWDATYEDATVIDPADREVHFGQHDHVRYFGRDVRDRIRSAGFELTEYTAREPAVMRHGLARGEKIFVAQKPAAASESR